MAWIAVLWRVMWLLAPHDEVTTGMYGAMGMSELDYPRTALYALVATESCGKEWVHKTRGDFRGPLQIGRSYAIEAGVPHQSVMVWPGALLAWLRVQRRYRVRRPGEPTLVLAIFHKGGPGTLRLARRLVGRGHSWRVAARRAAAKYKIPNMGEFINRFEMAERGDARWCGGETWMQRRSRPAS